MLDWPAVVSERIQVSCAIGHGMDRKERHRVPKE